MSPTIAICSAQALPATSIPEWVHLLPAGQVRTVDGRGPYTVSDMTALCAASMAGGKLALDENHATDLAAPKGLSAPARGWIVALQARRDGIWGKVEWTPEGRKLVPGYRGISPVIRHDKQSGRIDAILRASLTNTPNLSGLVTLHSEAAQDVRKWLIDTLSITPEGDMNLAGKEATRFLRDAAREAMEPDGTLSAADHDMIARLGSDPATYLATKMAEPSGVPGFRDDLARRLGVPLPAQNETILQALVGSLNESGISYVDLHSATERRCSAAEQSVMRLLGIDALRRE
ncbi:MAG: phage protease [Sphingomonas pseudosanguinis]|uniref:phage protease n=1 Tax=Sphingomonas pseudosanguinis TaxID=413712 RepID=UPI003918D94A